MDINFEKGDKVLFYQPWGLGDMEMFSPVIYNFKRLFPQVRCDLICRKFVSVLMANCPRVEKIHILPSPDNRTLKNVLSTVSAVRRERYKLIFPATCITLNYMGNIFTRISGAKYKAGNLRGCIIWDRFDFGCPLDTTIHRVDQNLRLFESIFGEAAGFEYEFHNPVTPEAEKHAFERLNKLNFADKPILGVHMGCDPRNRFKQWPLDRYYELLKGFLNDFSDGRVLLFVGPGEEYTAQGLPESDRTEVIRENLAVAAAYISRCRLILTNDSGVGHIARGCGRPAVAIMGPGSVRQTKPYGEDGYAISLYPPLECMPCLPGKPSCNGKYPCIDKLSVDIVRNTVYSLWGKYT